MDLELATVKKFCRIDHDYEDDLMLVYRDAAKSVIQGAVTKREKYSNFYEDNSMYALAVLQLTKHYYDNRSATTEFNLKAAPIGVLTLIQSLRQDYAKWVPTNGTPA